MRKGLLPRERRWARQGAGSEAQLGETRRRINARSRVSRSTIKEAHLASMILSIDRSSSKQGRRAGRDQADDGSSFAPSAEHQPGLTVRPGRPARSRRTNGRRWSPSRAGAGATLCRPSTRRESARERRRRARSATGSEAFGRGRDVEMDETEWTFGARPWSSRPTSFRALSLQRLPLERHRRPVYLALGTLSHGILRTRVIRFRLSGSSPRWGPARRSAPLGLPLQTTGARPAPLAALPSSSRPSSKASYGTLNQKSSLVA